MKWIIDKSFSWEGGHRVHAQKLDRPDLSISTECKCRSLHGHSYTAKVFLGADSLDQSAMVTDFKNINFMKEFVDNVLDHKFMIDVNDPLFSTITNVTEDVLVKIKDSTVIFTNLDTLLVALGESHDTDYHSGFVLVDFVPTSENICRHLYEYAQTRLGDFATVTSVELWETAKSHCTYGG